MEQQFKRAIAYKLNIGRILAGKPILEADKLKFLEINSSQVFRVNIIANLVDKYIQDGEKKFSSLTIDDGSGQIKIKNFGEEAEKMNAYNLGDTLLIIGLLKIWNNEIYVAPEITKKKEPSCLLLRKLEIESEMPKEVDHSKLIQIKDKILALVKEAEKEGGIDIEKIILELKERPDTINQEIKKLLEEGIAYEPRPGKLRYLG